MSFRYPRPLMFNLGQRMRGRQYLSADAERLLLSQKVIVEEKMGGRLCIFEAERFLLCSEDMRKCRGTFYRVPARYAVFDVFEKELDVFLDGDGKREVVGTFMRNPRLLPEQYSQGVFQIPVLAAGEFSVCELSCLANESRYALDPKTRMPVPMEGLVVKPDAEEGLGRVCGMVVRTAASQKIRARDAGRPAFNEMLSALSLS